MAQDFNEDPMDRNASQILGRIAQTLNVPLTTLFSNRDLSPSIGSLSAAELKSLAQTTEMLRIFVKLKDVDARERCLDFVKSEIEQQK
ncbi:hypothetical protein [Methylobacterium sp. E-045]|uniref:hypothetical protein n=1 Tax=Methylobacterium sp. E-045 TaxID=2836575 RepID=UPI001FB8FCA0|nr:hypothetical protein [Methylobacterium sp. E-045]MCJ2132186.1 hypothetical protein [Methylobacterium sp. E-045]